MFTRKYGKMIEMLAPEDGSGEAMAGGDSGGGDDGSFTSSGDTSTGDTGQSPDGGSDGGSEEGSEEGQSTEGQSTDGQTSGDTGGEGGPEVPPWLKQAKKDNQNREELWSLQKIDDLIAERDRFKEKADKAPEVPEEYNLKITKDGDEQGTKELAAKAKELGMTQEQLDFAMEQINEKSTAVAKEMVKQIADGYTAQSAKDLFQKEWGKDFDKHYTDMRRGIKIMGKSFEQILGKTGLGNNPSVVRALSALGSKFSEDDTPLSESQGGIVDDNTAFLKQRYPSMFK